MQLKSQKRKLAKQQALAIMMTLITTATHAHTPLFDCYKNHDDTITCEGGFSDGSSATGNLVQVRTVFGRILTQATLDEAGAITFNQPDEEYVVVFAPDSQHQLKVLGDEIL